MPNHDIETLQAAVEARAQLCSIFDRITTDGGPPPVKRNGLDPSMLKNQNIVTNTGGLLPDAPHNDLAQLSALHSDAQDDTYYYLLQKYGWRIGQPGGEELQDVPFCDAVRIQRALEQKDGANGYLLVKGDLSGIQEYIYGGIQQKTAGGLAKLSKRLRGRSILVTLLTDFLANVALRELDLPVWNLLFAGGGHFNLLLPDTAEMRKDLEEFDKKLDSEMRSIFGDRLHLILAWVECSEKQIKDEAGLCFERLNAAREQKKYQQHRGGLKAHFYTDEPPETEEQKQRRDDKETEIGQAFPRQQIVVEAVGGHFKTNDKVQKLVSLHMDGQMYSLLAFEKPEDSVDELAAASGLESAQVFTLNHTDFLPNKEAWEKIAQPISFGFRFLGKYVPDIDAPNLKTGKMENRPKTFEEIAQTDALEMLGAIRLDVDDLGYIFSQGMHKATLGQIVTLSREMHYFFSAHFDQLAAQKKHQLYLIYSGGDDAFAVGQWKNLIDFAQQLQADFQKFTFGNKAVHFSAGIFLGDPKYPVGRFYLDAGELLDEAKKSNDDKDRIHVFHNITRWEAFDKKIKFGNGLASMLEKDHKGETRKLSMAFAYHLLTLVKTSFYERTDIINGKKVKRGSLNHRRFARNISNMCYLFARQGYNEKQAAEVVSEVEKQLINDFFRNFKFGGSTTEQSMRDNLVALNYALYTIRSQKNAEQ